MVIPLWISRSLYGDAQKSARAEHRTIAGQVEYWARVGRASLDNPELPVELVCLILTAQNRRAVELFFVQQKKHPWNRDTLGVCEKSAFGLFSEFTHFFFGTL